MSKRHPLQDQRDAAIRLLEEAREAIESHHPIDRAYLDLYLEFMDHNELGLALDVLTDVTEERAYGDEVRLKLAAAASMGIAGSS